MLNSKEQINKMGVKKQTNKGTVKNQTNKSDTKKKQQKTMNVNKVYECINCGFKYIGDKKRDVCVCSHENTFVIRTDMKIGD